MRAFVAIDLPSELQNHLRELQGRIIGGKFSYQRDFHLTLKFLGEISEGQADEVKQRLSGISHKAFFANSTGIGFFPSEKHINVIWIGAEPIEKFVSLHDEIESLLNGMFPKDDFVPHVTLARAKFIDDKDAFLEKMKRLEIKLSDFPVDKIKLKESTLTQNGPVYGDIEEFPMQQSL